MTAEDEERAEPLEVLKDLLVYAPIGLILDAETVAPDLAKRGRQHTAAARQIGELAVKAGKRRLDDFLEQARQTGEDAASDIGAGRSPQPGADAADTSGEAVEASRTSGVILAIEDYDSLAASQIVKRLDALSAEELAAIEEYETANRGRRTILSKLARLSD